MCGSVRVEWKRYLSMIGIIAGVYVGLRYIFPVVIPFFIGWLMAVWIYPCVCTLERKFKIKRSIWAGIFMSAAAVLTVFLLYKIGVVCADQITSWIRKYPAFEAYCGKLMRKCCESVENTMGIPQIQTQTFLTDYAKKIGDTCISGMGSKMLIQIAGWVKTMAFVISGAVIAVISGILFVKDLVEIRKQLRTFRFYPKWRRVLIRLKETGVTYLKAQVIIMAVIAAICVGALWIMKNSYYLVLGIGLGIMDALPVIGTGLVTYPAAIVYFLKGDFVMAAGFLVIEFLTSIVRELMEPRLIGKKVGTYPVVIMAAVYVGLFVFGIWGVVLGPAALLLIYSIGKEWDIWD